MIEYIKTNDKDWKNYQQLFVDFWIDIEKLDPKIIYKENKYV